MLAFFSEWLFLLPLLCCVFLAPPSSISVLPKSNYVGNGLVVKDRSPTLRRRRTAAGERRGLPKNGKKLLN